jgi:hypothetical protein
MMLANKTSRYHVAVAAVRGGALVNEKVALVSHEIITKFMHMAQKAREYALEHGQGENFVVVASVSVDADCRRFNRSCRYIRHT